MESGSSGRAPRAELLPVLLKQSFAAAQRNVGMFNLALFGISGTGKSTLVNAVFGEPLAETGIGRPVTQGSTLYRRQSSVMGVFDNAGLEVGPDLDEILKDLKGQVVGTRGGPSSDQIHVVWYCVLAQGDRFQPSEEAFIRAVDSLGLPIVLVLTQTPLGGDGDPDEAAQNLAEYIRSLTMPIWNDDVYFVNAERNEFSDTPQHGLRELLAATQEAAPLGVQAALNAAQRLDGDHKRSQSLSFIHQAVDRIPHEGLDQDGVVEAWADLIAEISVAYDLPYDDMRDAVLQALDRLDEGPDDIPRWVRFTTGRVLGVFLYNLFRPSIPGYALIAAGGGVLGAWMSKRIARRRELVGDVTRMVGEAWMEACSEAWNSSYPNRPTWDPRALTDVFLTNFEGHCASWRAAHPGSTLSPFIISDRGSSQPADDEA